MLEVERTWEFAGTTELPALDGAPDGDGGTLRAVDGGTVELVATYHDTADLRLARSRVTLRRRTGGKDAGWHLKLPAGRDREEVQRPLGRATTAPPQLRALIRSRTRGEPIVPVVELRTTRHLVVVTDAAGNSAEVADDRVTATRLGAVTAAVTAGVAAGTGVAPGSGGAGTASVVTWREVEVELLDGADPAVLEAVGAVLAAAGARPSDWQSKLGRALATTTGGAAQDPPAPTGDVAAVLGYVAEQVAVITAQDPRVRLHEDDAVHAMRVATRRLRSTLRTFGDLWRPEALDGVGDELHALATALGEVRDREVLTARFTATLLALAGDPTGPDRALAGLLGDRSAAEVAASLVPGRADADRALLRALDSRRYLRLLDRLVSLSEPDALVPAGAAADRSALLALADQARRTLARRLRRAHGADHATDHDTDAQLHRARRAVKRTRYAAEALVPLGGAAARRFVDAHRALAQVLGDHQDAVVARLVLAAVVARDPAAAAAPRTGPTPGGEVAFAAGLLYRDEQLRAAAALAGLPAVERAAGRRRLRRWLD